MFTANLTWRQWVKHQLENRDMTQSDLAKTLGCSRTTLWRALDSEDGNGLRERIIEVLTP